jgi:acetyl esterase/lipase
MGASVALVACGVAGPTIGETMNETSETTETTASTETTETSRATPVSPITITYGDAPEQLGELHLPERRDDRRDDLRDEGGDGDGADPSPVVALVHGGFWRNPYDLTLMDPLAADLVERGYAVWNIEYRRVGDDGGGWPGTLTDVAAAIDELAVIAGDHPIDLDRVAVVGHSAGGHLALWASGRAGLPRGAPGASPVVVPTIAVGQGAVVDLIGAAVRPLGNGAVTELLGGTPDEMADRYEIARPRLDAGPRMVSVVGTNDEIVPPQYSIDPSRPDAIEVVEIDGADHFDLIDPTHAAWSAVVRALERWLE